LIEAFFERLSNGIALAIEFAAILLILAGAAEAFLRSSLYFRTGDAAMRFKRQTWVHFAAWLVLALEFELGADIIRTAIAPTWNDIGQLAAIALIRTFLNFFLGRDIDKYEALTATQPPAQ